MSDKAAGSLLTTPELNWEDIRSFLETARRGSFTAAAAHLGLSINSVRRRVANLENSVAHQLLLRGPDGIRLTSHGHQVMETAKMMEDVSVDLLGVARPKTSERILTIRLGIQDSFGPLWLAPHLGEYRTRSPNVIVELLCAFRSNEVLQLGADIFLHVGRAPRQSSNR